MKIDDEDEDQSQDEDFLGKAVVCHMQRLLEGVFFQTWIVEQRKREA